MSARQRNIPDLVVQRAAPDIDHVVARARNRSVAAQGLILYALIAVLVWPSRSGGSGAGVGGVAAASPLGRRWSAAAWVVLWGSFAYLILQPAVRAPRALSGTLAGEAAGEPGWLAALDRDVATAAGSHGLAVSVVLAAVFILIAAGLLFPATARPALALAIIAGLAFWVVGQDFGYILTGTGTDPNSGLLLILLAAAYWPLQAGNPREPAIPPTSQPVVGLPVCREHRATPLRNLSDRRHGAPARDGPGHEVPRIRS